MLGLASWDYSVEPSVSAETGVFGPATGGQYHQATLNSAYSQRVQPRLWNAVVDFLVCFSMPDGRVSSSACRKMLGEHADDDGRNMFFFVSC